MDSDAKKPAVVPLLLENYIHMAKTSVGSPLFRNFYCTVDGAKKDILRDGDLSCAFFVSWILMPFRLLKETHATVAGTVKDLKENGWTQIDSPKPGAIIVWTPQAIDGELHAHIGIALGEGLAISNDFKKRSPQIHPWDSRPVHEILWHPKLDEEKE
jgi:hypothetical protein